MAAIRRLLLALLAFVVIALGLTIVVQTVAALLGWAWPVPRQWATTLISIQVSDRRVLITSAAIAVIGLLILVVQLTPRRQRRLPTAVDGPYWLQRRAAENRLVAAATRAGVTTHAHAEIRATPDRWRVEVSGNAPMHRKDAVEQAIRDELTGLGAPADREVTLALRTPGRVS